MQDDTITIFGEDAEKSGTKIENSLSKEHTHISYHFDEWRFSVCENVILSKIIYYFGRYSQLNKLVILCRNCKILLVFHFSLAIKIQFDLEIKAEKWMAISLPESFIKNFGKFITHEVQHESAYVPENPPGWTSFQPLYNILFSSWIPPQKNCA